MSDTGKQLFILQLKIDISVQSSIDIVKIITSVSKTLSDTSSVSKCLHKLKVSGEPRIIAVMEVKNVVGLEKTLAGLARMASVEVVYCKPLVPYEEFAKNTLGLDEKLTKPSPDCLLGVKHLVWAEVTVEYPGKSMDDLLRTWNKEATFALGARAAGELKVALFKVSGERKVHLITSLSVSDFDSTTFKLPLMLENGNNTCISTHSMQELDSYISDVSKIKM